MRILVSACLLGRNCKYSGGNNLCPRVCRFVQGHEVIAVCPEEQAGLGVPRTPMELVDGVLINKDGVVVDGPVRQAVEEKGLLGALTGGLTATAGGITAAMLFALIAALIFKPGDKR